MDEAKSLINMALSAMFASMFLAAAVGLISIGYMLWGSLARQDAANKKLATYANYTAFDSTTVRGQDVISLLESKPEVFVFIYNGSSNTTNINEMTVNGTLIAKYVPSNPYVKDFIPNTISPLENSFETCKNALNVLKSNNNKISSIPANHNLTNTPHDDLVAYFTDGFSTTNNSGKVLGLPADSDTSDKHAFAAFKSVLVYDSDSTSDIIGIVLVRQTKYIDEF